MWQIIHHWPKDLAETIMPDRFKTLEDAIKAALSYTKYEYEHPSVLGHHSYEILKVYS